MILGPVPHVVDDLLPVGRPVGGRVGVPVLECEHRLLDLRPERGRDRRVAPRGVEEVHHPVHVEVARVLEPVLLREDRVPRVRGDAVGGDRRSDPELRALEVRDHAHHAPGAKREAAGVGQVLARPRLLPRGDRVEDERAPVGGPGAVLGTCVPTGVRDAGIGGRGVGGAGGAAVGAGADGPPAGAGEREEGEDDRGGAEHEPHGMTPRS